MKLSTAQVQRFWREWAKSCKVMGWTREAGLTAAQIDTHRKDFLARCGFTSLTLVDKVNGFTKVLNELLVLQGTSIKAGIESEDLSINKARTIRHQIAAEIIPCLELYVEDVPAYITKIMEDKSRWWKLDRPVREMTILDLGITPIMAEDRRTGEMKEWPSQLEQFQFTLAARLNEKRNEAGHTIHEMQIKASVPCNCALCRRQRSVKTAPAAILALIDQSEVAPF